MDRQEIRRMIRFSRHSTSRLRSKRNELEQKKAAKDRKKARHA